MHVSSLLGCGPVNTGKWHIWRRLDRSWICFLWGFSLSFGKRKKITWCKIQGVGRVLQSLFSFERHTCTSFVCSQVRHHEEVWFHTCLGLGEVFLYFVCFQKNSLCSISPWCSFLPCMVSVAQCPLSQTILCKVPSSWSGITLQFGVQPHLPVPMLCSLLFLKGSK